jgi:peptidoglycan-associated lipoprotein
MKINRGLFTLTLAGLISLGIVGCGTQKAAVKEPEPVVKEEPKPEPVAVKPVEIDKTYFQYNDAKLSGAAKEALKKGVDLLLARPEVKINIDGHCDERGTDEYNMELGWKRAYAVRDYLKKMGVGESRLFPASYGRSRPAVVGNDEAVWNKNRRVEISERK